MFLILKKRFVLDDYVLFKKNRLNANYVGFMCSLNYYSIVSRSDYDHASLIYCITTSF